MEADKQNAAKLNALVQVTSPTEDWPIGGRSQPHSHGTSRGVHSEHRGPQQSNSSKSGSVECCTSGEVSKKQPGYIWHQVVVWFICKRYPIWFRFILLHGSWVIQLCSQRHYRKTQAALFVLFQQLGSSRHMSCIWEVSSSNLCQSSDYPYWCFVLFLAIPLANAGIVPNIRPLPLPSTSVPVILSWLV